MAKGGHPRPSSFYCVVTSFTIMLIIRDPRGHVLRSMLGFLILSCSSWSSSQRSSFTSSAIYNESCGISRAGSREEGFHREIPSYDYCDLRFLTLFQNTLSLCHILRRPIINIPICYYFVSVTSFIICLERSSCYVVGWPGTLVLSPRPVSAGATVCCHSLAC